MTLLEQGFIIMVLGMGVVFLLLILLVYSMMIMSKVVQYINTIWPEPVEESVSSVGAVALSGNDEEAIAVVIATIMHKSSAFGVAKSV